MTGRSGRKELEPALADALLLQTRELKQRSLGAEYVCKRWNDDVEFVHGCLRKPRFQ